MPSEQEQRVLVEQALYDYANRSLEQLENATNSRIQQYAQSVQIQGPLAYIPDVESIQMNDNEPMVFLGGYVQNISEPLRIFSFTEVLLQFSENKTNDVSILVSPELFKRAIFNAILTVNDLSS